MLGGPSVRFTNAGRGSSAVSFLYLARTVGPFDHPNYLTPYPAAWTTLDVSISTGVTAPSITPDTNTKIILHTSGLYALQETFLVSYPTATMTGGSGFWTATRITAFPTSTLDITPGGAHQYLTLRNAPSCYYEPTSCTRTGYIYVVGGGAKVQFYFGIDITPSGTGAYALIFSQNLQVVKL